jgi:hypothetical protein
MFIKNKIVSRSGKYEKIMDQLANTNFKEGSNKVDAVNVKINKDGIQVMVEEKSEVYSLELNKKNKRAPITKSFRSIVSLWKSMRIRLGK